MTSTRAADDPCFASAVDLAAWIRRGTIGAAECLDMYLRRIESRGAEVNAIALLLPERARRRALAADRARRDGASWGPLHGVPVTVKESFDLAGHPTTVGDPDLARVATSDDEAVIRLESTGAVVFGKTSVPRRLADVQTYNPIHGVTRNPWDLRRSPGGSSGGSAAAVAAGLTALDLGSDLGGSIRNPAHACGVFGHRPTFRREKAVRTGPPGRTGPTDMAEPGPLARSAEDLAVIVSGAALRAPARPLRGHRVVVWWHEPGFEVDVEIADACQALADRLAALGVEVSDRAHPAFDAARAFDLFLELLDAARSGQPSAGLEDRRAWLGNAWQELFASWDAVLMPVAPTAAIEHDHGPIDDRTVVVNGRRVPYVDQLFWPSLASTCHLPATAFPAGRTGAGLPIGLQVVAPSGDDLLAIDLVRRITGELGGFVPPPSVT